MSPLACHSFLSGLLLAGVVSLSSLAPVFANAADTNGANVRPLRLEECIFTALRQNRQLQIERLTPVIARSQLSSAYGYYDPIFLADAYAQDSEDPGGFDPTDFSRDAVYGADSETAHADLTGFLPWGMSYSVFGNYAHSDGVRNGLNFESYTSRAGVMLRQRLLRDFWIDAGRLTIQINKRNLAITELGVHYVAMDVVNRVQQAYYELAFAEQNLREQREFYKLREALLNSVRQRIEAGTLTVLDERLAESRLATVAAAVAEAENAVHLAENELRLVLGAAWTNAADSRLSAADPLVAVPQQFNLQNSWQYGLAKRPDLAQLREEVAKANFDLRFRRNQLFPTFDIVASHSRKGSSTEQLFPPARPNASFDRAWGQLENNDGPTDQIGFIFSIPLGLSAERANFRASKSLKEQAELRVKQYEEIVMREISDAHHTARTHLQRVMLTRRARELAESALEAENQKLIGGKSTVFFVLELQSDLAAARAAELRAQADYNRARSQLQFAEGSLLEHWRMTIEVK